MEFNGQHDPSAVLDVFRCWEAEAELYIFDIGGLRSCLAFRDSNIDPWPSSPSALSDKTELISKWMRNVHGFDGDCFKRIAEAAKTWHADHSHERLPEQETLDLELWIARVALESARFPLYAEVNGANATSDARLIQRAYVYYVLMIRDGCWALIHDWPPESEARWRYKGVVTPGCVIVYQTPFSLALAEARRNGELAVMAPMLEAVDHGLSDYLDRFIMHHQGNIMIPEPTALINAVNRIVPYFGIEFEYAESKYGGRAGDRAAPAGEEATHRPAGGERLIDPIRVVDVVKVVGQRAGRSDKLAAKMKRRNYPVEKIARKWHCQRADAVAMFPHHKQRIEEI